VREGNHMAMVRENPNGTRTPLGASEAQVRVRAAHPHQEEHAPPGQEQKQASKHTRRGRGQRLCAPERAQMQEVSPCRARLSG
jgi:hypothetical protein